MKPLNNQPLTAQDVAIASIRGPIGLTIESPNPESTWVVETLFRNLNFDLEWVADVIDPVLTAQNRCQNTSFYLQGIITKDRAFLSTNLNHHQELQLTLCDTRWVIGQSPECAISYPLKGLDSCHGVVRFDPEQGFLLMDLDSEQGTWVNHCRLLPAQRHLLRDGDVVRFGPLRFEFFQEYLQNPPGNTSLPGETIASGY